MTAPAAASVDAGPFPFPDDFQYRLVSCCLVDRKFLQKYERSVKAAYFTAPHLADVFKIIAGFHEAHRAVPSSSLFVELVVDEARRREVKPSVAASWRDAAERVVAVPAGDAEYTRERFTEWVRSQVIASTAMQLAALHEDAARTGRADTAAMFDAMQRAIQDCAIDRGADVLDYFGDTVQRVYSDHNATRVPTGYASLDASLEGGVDRGELLEFLANPTMGKTSLLVGAARGALLYRHRVFVVTNEVSPRRWAARLDRAITGRTRREILDDPRGSIRLIQRLRQVTGRCFIKGFPTGAATVSDIRATLAEIRDARDFLPDVIIVDYADELRSSRFQHDYRLGAIDVYRELRALAQEQNVPVLTAGQAGKQAEGKEILNLRDQAEAYGKSAVADIVIALCQTDEEAKREPYPECRLFGAKNREGQRRFNLPYVFRAERGIIVPAAWDGTGEDPGAPPTDVVAYGEERR